MSTVGSKAGIKGQCGWLFGRYVYFQNHEGLNDLTDLNFDFFQDTTVTNHKPHKRNIMQ